MMPAQRDVDAALDLLAWLTDDEVRPLRQGVTRAIELASARREAGVVPAAPAEPWSPVAKALFWILWQTSNEYLAAKLGG